MFKTIKNSLYVEGVKVEEIAEKFGTPLYLYSQTQMIENFKKFDLAFSFFPPPYLLRVKSKQQPDYCKNFAPRRGGQRYCFRRGAL